MLTMIVIEYINYSPAELVKRLIIIMHNKIKIRGVLNRLQVIIIRVTRKNNFWPQYQKKLYIHQVEFNSNY